MKAIATAALMVALIISPALAPALARADAPRNQPAQVASARGAPLAASATDGEPASEAAGYAARELGNPALAEFTGGDGGVYIGGGALTIVLLVILILILV